MLIVKDKQTGQQLQDLIKGPGNVIVLYYADWCGHCVRFKPEWAKFKSEMARKHPNLCTVAEVEQSHLSNVPAAQVQGYPTIKFYRPISAPAKTANVPGFNFIAKMLGGSASENSGSNEVPFEGDRTVNTLVQFVKDNRVDTNETAQPVNTAAKLASLPSSHTKHNNTKKHGRKTKGKRTQKQATTTSLGKLAEKKGLAKSVARSKEYKEGSKKYVKARAQNKSVIKQVNDAFNKMFG
jgi:thiol-disulfide isomerase/thioredoxin